MFSDKTLSLKICLVEKSLLVTVRSTSRQLYSEVSWQVCYQHASPPYDMLLRVSGLAATPITYMRTNPLYTHTGFASSCARFFCFLFFLLLLLFFVLFFSFGRCGVFCCCCFVLFVCCCCCFWFCFLLLVFVFVFVLFCFLFVCFWFCLFWVCFALFLFVFVCFLVFFRGGGGGGHWRRGCVCGFALHCLFLSLRAILKQVPSL